MAGKTEDLMLEDAEEEFPAPKDGKDYGISSPTRPGTAASKMDSSRPGTAASVGFRLPADEDGSPSSRDVRPQSAPAAISEAKAPPRGGLSLVRVHDGNAEVSGLLGHLFRNPITGFTYLKGGRAKLNDFTLVDLFTRPGVTGYPSDLQDDRFLFRPIPMAYRTWAYHDFFLKSRMMADSGAEPDAMLKYALNSSCIDAPVAAGRWSPVVAYVYLLPGVCLAGEIIVIAVGILVMSICLILSHVMNSPETYLWVRPCTLLLRIVYMILLVAYVLPSGTPASAFAILGYLWGIGCCWYDLLGGDLNLLIQMRLSCTYEILSPLPGRVFICRRLGAAGSEEMYGPRMGVSETITGVSDGVWRNSKTLTLIADLEGIIVELMPVRTMEWLSLQNEFIKTNTPRRLIGLDIFDDEEKTSFRQIMSTKKPVQQQRRF
eukprot:gnl/TRDRNA2_/TRDRNA2_183110_c0_seq1.p1 gnl/TRDRNA2_/TRDRNA2_183110_c0~~gnl/TRDRNA2_/TRDRNA2_183110_c0_seq1.p1  ORF type:complete len:432 (-),score=43.74 gnl/TRDRNA2_/TRDRNA2_183110_c0_seq1:104-1399(-)